MTSLLQFDSPSPKPPHPNPTPRPTMQSMPSIGGSVVMFAGAMLGASGSSWAIRNGEAIPLVSVVAPIAAIVFTVAIVSLIIRLRQRMGSPLTDAETRRQWWILGVAFLSGSVGGLWVGLTMAAPVAANVGGP